EGPERRPASHSGGERAAEEVGDKSHVEPGEGDGEGDAAKYLVPEERRVLVIAEGPAGPGADQFGRKGEECGDGEEDEDAARPQRDPTEDKDSGGTEDDVRRAAILHAER